MNNPEKWYFKTSTLVIAILSIGPLALPLAWFNPRFSLKAKVIISVATIVVTYASIILIQQSLKQITVSYQQIFGQF